MSERNRPIGLVFAVAFAALAIGCLAGFAFSEFVKPRADDNPEQIADGDGEPLGKIVSLTADPPSEEFSSGSGLGVGRTVLISNLQETYKLREIESNESELSFGVGKHVIVKLLGPSADVSEILVIGAVDPSTFTDLARAMVQIGEKVWSDSEWLPKWLGTAYEKVDSNFSIYCVREGMRIELTGDVVGEVPVMLLKISPNK